GRRAGAGRRPAGRRNRARAIAAALARTHPDAWCALHYRTPWELVVATILSAQCTDAMVNQVTPHLFAELPTPDALAAAPAERVEALIKRTGFFRQKTKSLPATARAIVARHGGGVPRTVGASNAPPGRGRKPANGALGRAFGQPPLLVDTHVRRVSNRLGLTVEDAPDKIERALQQLLPPREWTAFAHRMIHHGR